MKIADDRHIDTHKLQSVADIGHGLGGFVAVDRDADDLGARGGKGRDLLDGGIDVRRIGIGHGLDNDGRAAAHGDAADPDGHAVAPRRGLEDALLDHDTSVFPTLPI